jgi:MarR family transcriptional regulator, 2-MHQ and catechol-resistance regulon repressor
MTTEDTQAPPEGVDIWVLLWRAVRASEETARRGVKTTGMCLADFATLRALLHRGPLAVGAIRGEVLLTSGSMTAAVDRLERAGLVRRADAPEDRRSCIVHLTADGTALIQRLYAEHARVMERQFSCLDPQERGELARLLRKLERAGSGPDARDEA